MTELLFFITIFVDLLFVLGAWRLGKEWVFVTIVVNIVLTTTFAGKLIPLFGLTTTAAGPFYAAIFIATDILTEHHGKRVGYRSVWMGFSSLVLFVSLGQLILQLPSIEDTLALSNGLQSVFAAAPRIAFSSLLAYVIAQNTDIWIYHWIHDRTGQRWLWLRNNVSTWISQLLDSLIFFFVAFVGIIPFGTLVEITLIGYLVKLGVSVIDTPFIYLSYIVKGERPPDFSAHEGGMPSEAVSSDST